MDYRAARRRLTASGRIRVRAFANVRKILRGFLHFLSTLRRGRSRHVLLSDFEKGLRMRT
jgi:hypothetical protein